MAPSWIGDAVRVTARCAEVIGNKLICDVRAVDERGRELGRGTTAQAVLVQEVLHARIGEQARKPVRPVDADDRSGRVPTSEASSTISTAHSPERTEGEGPAVTVSYFALYRTPADPADFEKHYFGSHVPLIEKTPGLLENRVHRVTRQFVGDPGYYLLAELVFESQEAMKQAFRSPEWAAAGENLSAWGGIDLVTMFTAQPHQPVDAPSGD